jgi:hypothetical protein
MAMDCPVLPDLDAPEQSTPPTDRSFAGLLKRTGGEVRIACDTEFEGPHTLSIQFATRTGDDIVVQVYRSPAIPPPPSNFDVEKYVPVGLRPRIKRIIVRPVREITPELSPARVLFDLFELQNFHVMKKRDGDGLRRAGLLAAPLTVHLIAHFWTADFFRVFGEQFYTSLIEAQIKRGGRIVIQTQKLLGFKEVARGANRYQDPVLQYVLKEDDDDVVHPIRIRTFDTLLPFGKVNLGDHAQTFLGVTKLSAISKKDKERMRRTFRRKPGKAYGYSILDVILTLLVEERMREEDRRMYKTLGFEEKAIPPLRATQGARVAETITLAIARDTAAGSTLLSRKGEPLQGGGAGAVAMGKVKALLTKGSGDFIAGEKISKFGKQTGEAHGGLLFSRSPAEFFHAGVGHFRDVDLSGCYASILGRMSLYVGRPVVHEPGPGKMRLKDAIPFLSEYAASWDAWIIKASGPIKQMPNVLIPSTSKALTHANYQKRVAKKRAKSKRYGFIFDWLYEARKATGNACLFTDVIEAGIVAWPTWLMIQALPPAARAEYENLEVETILFYPAKMVADSGPEYDSLVEKYALAKAPWTETLDMDSMQQVTVEQFDSDYVSLRFPIGGLAKKVLQFRQEAKAKYGKGSGAELGWKQHGNTMYGVAASRYLVTNNVVCANVITATARALAFAMQLSLNGFQVITDGCTYRRDRVPDATLAECLAASAEYPIRRVDEGLTYVDAGAVPEEDEAFTAWYRQHVKRFFAVEDAAYDWLFGIHALEHKRCGEPERVSFDGLCCDGSGNYLKLVQGDNGWGVLEFKARSYKKEDKALLEPWILETYVPDRYTAPPPITESASLLSYKDAVREGRMALKYLEGERSPEEREQYLVRIYLPLGLDRRKFQAYKVIKQSAFLFRTPAQREKIGKAMQKFADAHACGLEVLALRRGHGGRRKGSITDLAEAIYAYIRAGGDNLTKELNLTRRFKELDQVQAGHYQVLQDRRQAARVRLYRTVDDRSLDKDALLTGLYVQALDIIEME